MGTSPNTLFWMVQLFTGTGEADRIKMLNTKSLKKNLSRVDKNKSDTFVNNHQIWHKMAISVNQGEILKTQQTLGQIVHSFYTEMTTETWSQMALFLT